MTTGDPLDEAFRALRDAVPRPKPGPVPPEELDALLERDGDPAERLRVAESVVDSRQAREQLALLLAADTEVEAEVARAQRRRFRFVTGTAMALAAAVLAMFTLLAGGPPELTGRVLVAEADPPKDFGYPGWTRAALHEHLLLSDAPAGRIAWVALDVGTGLVAIVRTGAAERCQIAQLGGSTGGVLLVAATSGSPDSVAAQLRNLRTPDIVRGAEAGGGAVAGILARSLTRASLGSHAVLHVLEIR